VLRSPFTVARFGVGAVLLIGICSAHAIDAGSKPFSRLDPNAFQSFVVNWADAEQPFCRTMLSASDWDRWLKPAATMGFRRPFAPPAKLWNSHAVLLVARVVSAGDTSDVFSHLRMTGDERELALDYRFAPNPPASSTMKWYLALEIPKPLPPTVVVRENGRSVCTLHPAVAQPASPSSQ
jgi:hypothetical protein